MTLYHFFKTVQRYIRADENNERKRLIAVGARTLVGKSGRGFTLIEMLVVVAVIVVVTSTVIANNNRFGGTVLLQNLAYDIALTARESQVYGISVRNFNGQFTSPFGMYFTTSDPYAYVMFADANNNHQYDTSPASEYVQSANITGGYSIGQLCVTSAGGSEDCSPTKLSIIYIRPEPDAYIYADISNFTTLYQRARVVVQSPRGDTLSIWVESNGQISVHN